MSGEQLRARHLEIASAPDQKLDIAPVLSDVLPAHVRAGRYSAVFVKAERREPFGRKAVYLWFRLLAAPGQVTADGVHLYMSCPLRPDGQIAPSSKYARTWQFVAGRLASRRDRMSSRIFDQKLFTVAVRDVTTDHHQRPLRQTERYSIVEAIVEVQTGGSAR